MSNDQTTEENLSALNDDSQLRDSDEIFEGSKLNTQTASFVDMGDDVEYADKPEVEGYDGNPSYEDAEDHFQRHFGAFLAGTAKNIDYFEPAYHFGYEVAISDAYESDAIIDVEDTLENMWKETNPNTWDMFQTAVLYGWKVGYNMTHDVEIVDPREEAPPTE